MHAGRNLEVGADLGEIQVSRGKRRGSPDGSTRCEEEKGTGRREGRNGGSAWRQPVAPFARYIHVQGCFSWPGVLDSRAEDGVMRSARLL